MEKVQEYVAIISSASFIFLFEFTCCEGQALPNECPEDACSQQIKNQFGNIHMKFSLQLCHATKYILDQIWNFGDLKIEKTFTIVERNKDPFHFLGDVKEKSKWFSLFSIKWRSAVKMPRWRDEVLMEYQEMNLFWGGQAHAYNVFFCSKSPCNNEANRSNSIGSHIASSHHQHLKKTTMSQIWADFSILAFCRDCHLIFFRFLVFTWSVYCESPPNRKGGWTTKTMPPTTCSLLSFLFVG